MDRVIIKLVIIEGWPYQCNHGVCYDVTAACALHFASIFHSRPRLSPAIFGYFTVLPGPQSILQNKRAG